MITDEMRTELVEGLRHILSDSPAKWGRADWVNWFSDSLPDGAHFRHGISSFFCRSSSDIKSKTHEK